MMYLGDFAPLSTVYCYFSTAGADGARIAFSDALEVGDVRVYKNGSTTERSSTAGFTVTTAFDTLVGVHLVAIDTSDNTDAGFYAAGNEYTIVLYPDTETVDTKAPSAILGQFSIARKPAGCVLQGTAQAGAAGTITLPTTAVATDSYYNGDLVVIIAGTGVGQANAIASYVGATKVATMGVNWITTPDTTSIVQVFPGTSAPSAADVTKWNGTTVATPAVAGYPVVTHKVGTGTGELDITAGVVKANLVQILATALTETAGQIAAGFKQFFNIASPTSTMNTITAVTTTTTATNLTNAPTSGDLTATMKTSVKTQVTDALNVDTYAEPAAVPAATATLVAKIGFLMAKARNKVTQTATTQLVRNDADAATIATSTVSDDGTTFTRGKFV